jgi:L-lactate dehydrogenase complex protein LldG
VSAREEILGRVRRALADVPGEEPASWDVRDTSDPAATYVREAGGSPAELLQRFAERCGAYRAHVARCVPEEAAIAAAVAAACARHRVGSLVVPAGVPAAWVPDDVRVVNDDPPLSPAALDGADGVLTGCALAIAPTGTIILDAGSGQGRRAITLVPDLHVCVVRAEQIVAGVPEAIAGVRASVDAGRPITLISGPSATSDIELKRVEGVHGPRRLEVVLAG